MRGCYYSSLAFLFALSGGSSALWGTIIFENDLPNAVDSSSTPWVNLAAGANAANTSWQTGFFDSGSSGPWDILGGEFTFAGGATVNTITVYEIANTSCTDSTCTAFNGNASPSSEFSSVSLYVGKYTGSGAGVPALQTSTYVASQVFYSPGTSYEDSSGDYFPIYALTFTLPTPFLAAAGKNYAFAVDGVVSSTELTADPSAGLFLSATNVNDALASSTLSNPVVENAPRNEYAYYQETSQGASTASYLALPSSGPGPNPDPNAGFCNTRPNTTNFCSGAWNKSSVLNVQIGGTLSPVTPEPGTIFLTCLGILAFASTKRRG